MNKMFQFESKIFRDQTRDFLLQNLLLDKWCLWLNGLKNHYGVTGDGLKEKLKNKGCVGTMRKGENAGGK